MATIEQRITNVSSPQEYGIKETEFGPCILQIVDNLHNGFNGLRGSIQTSQDLSVYPSFLLTPDLYVIDSSGKRKENFYVDKSGDKFSLSIPTKHDTKVKPMYGVLLDNDETEVLYTTVGYGGDIFDGPQEMHLVLVPLNYIDWPSILLKVGWKKLISGNKNNSGPFRDLHTGKYRYFTEKLKW